RRDTDGRERIALPPDRVGRTSGRVSRAPRQLRTDAPPPPRARCRTALRRARLDAHVAEQRRFAANASHELRTPLAITQTLLDVARKDPQRDNGELVERLHTVNSRVIDLTEALLALSRADQRSFAREPVDLSLIAEEATETLLPFA